MWHNYRSSNLITYCTSKSRSLHQWVLQKEDCLFFHPDNHNNIVMIIQSSNLHTPWVSWLLTKANNEEKMRADKRSMHEMTKHLVKVNFLPTLRNYIYRECVKVQGSQMDRSCSIVTSSHCQPKYKELMDRSLLMADSSHCDSGTDGMDLNTSWSRTDWDLPSTRVQEKLWKLDFTCTCIICFQLMNVRPKQIERYVHTCTWLCTVLYSTCTLC